VGNLARFTIGLVGSSPPGFDASPGDVLSFKLEAPAGVVQRWTLQVDGPSNPDAPASSKNAPLLTLVGSTAGEMVDALTVLDEITATLPGTPGHTYQIRSKVNGGLDANGNPHPDYVFERTVAIRSASGLRKIVDGEGITYGRRGVADAQNDLVDLGGGGGGGGAVATVFGRIGAVVAQAGDYLASQITNNSTITGATVAAALNTLGAAVVAASLLADGVTLQNVSGTLSVKALGIANSHVSASAAIAGTKISPNFGSQNIVTTGTLTMGANPAASNGDMRVRHGWSLFGRNAALAADVRVLDWGASASDQVRLGDSASQTVVNGSVLSLAVGGTSKITLFGSLAQFQAPIGFATANPYVSPIADATNGATSTIVMAFRGQNMTGTGATVGGDVEMASGTGATAGNARIKVGSTTVARWSLSTTDYVSFGALPATAGNIRLPAALSGGVTQIFHRNFNNTAELAVFQGSTTSADSQVFGSTASTLTTYLGGGAVTLTISNGKSVTLAGDSLTTQTSNLIIGGTAPRIFSADLVTNGATAVDMILQAQNATGTGATVGGNLQLISGTGATTGRVLIKVGATTVADLGKVSGDYLAFGASPATIGNLRTSVGFRMVTRDFSGGSNVNLLSYSTAGSGTDVFAVGGDSGGTGPGVNVNTGSGVLFNMPGGSSIAFGQTQTLFGVIMANLVFAVPSLSIRQALNSTPSQVGGAIVINAGDMTGSGSTGGDMTVRGGHGSGANGFGGHLYLSSGNALGTLGAAGEVYINAGQGTLTNGGVTIQVSATSTARFGRTTADYIAQGAAPATQGNLRAFHTWNMYGRNAALAANLRLLDWGGVASNQLTIGGTGVTTVIAGGATFGDGTVNMVYNGSTSGTGHDFQLAGNSVVSFTTTSVRLGTDNIVLNYGVQDVKIFHASNATTTNYKLTLQAQAAGSNGTYTAGSLDLAGGDANVSLTGTVTGGSTLIRGGTGNTSAVDGNVAIGARPASWQGMAKGVFIADRSTAPSGSPAGGGFLYVASGALRYRGSAGTDVQVAAA
jgi:hypothetical protein